MSNDTTPDVDVSDETINNFGNGLYDGLAETRKFADAADRTGGYQLGFLLGVLVKFAVLVGIGAEALPMA